MHSKAFDEFGEVFIDFARDLTIINWDILLDGKAPNSVAGQKLQSLLDSLNEAQLALLKDVMPGIVDETLHNVLLMFEQYDWIKIGLQYENETVDDIRHVAAGGLQGYIFIWAEKFSKQRLFYE